MSKVFKVFSAISTYGTYLLIASSVSAADDSLQAVGVDQNIDPAAVPQLIINGLFMVAAFLAVLYFMYGGIKWMTSRGDKVAVEAARKHIVAAVIGLVVVAGAFFAMNVVFKVLGACNPLSKGFTLPTLKSASEKQPGC